MVDYTFYVEDDTGIASKITQLETRISIDLDITKTLSSPATDYNNGTKILTISFDTSLSEDERLILSRLVDVNIFDKIPYVDVQTTLYNQTVRDSLASTQVPTVQHDIASYYNVGSTVIDPSTNNIYVCTDNTLNNAVWEKIISNLAIEGATGPTGDAYTGPLTVTNTDVIRYWSENLVLDISEGPNGPLIGIDTPGDIGFASGLGDFFLIFYSDQGAGYQSYVNFNKNAAFAEVTQFIYRGSSVLGGIPSTIKILFAGFDTGGAPSYIISLRLVTLTTPSQTILDWTREIIHGVDVVNIDDTVIQTLTAVDNPTVFMPGLLPTTETKMSLQMRCVDGNETRLYNITFF